MGRRLRKQKGTRRIPTSVRTYRSLVVEITAFITRVIIEHMAEHLENSRPLRDALVEANLVIRRVA